ncbi:hypothetical protein E0701_07115 [Lactobacillus helveticus]|nr:hypothetical protein [Lactobacillus helveticus]
MGLDAVDLDELPFDVKIKEAQEVKKGQLLVDMNIEMIKKNGKDPTVIVVLTQPDKILNNKTLKNQFTRKIYLHKRFDSFFQLCIIVKLRGKINNKYIFRDIESAVYKLLDDTATPQHYGFRNKQMIRKLFDLATADKVDSLIEY